MELAQIEEEHLQDASNILVLAPLSPWGTKAYAELLASATSAESNLAVVTYTQPPELWLSDWKNAQHPLPPDLTFVHGGPKQGEEITHEGSNITTVRVSPRDPMDIITTVTEELDRWDAPQNPSVVSVQTLTVLLEYVDFDTAFRYLHVLIHRIRGADATGYYQIDPSIHEHETINTLSVLFDVVIEAEEGATGDTEWSVVSVESRSIREDVTSDAPVESGELIESDGPGSLTEAIASPIAGAAATIRESWQALFHSDEEFDAAPAPQVESPQQPAPNGSAPVEDGSLLTDEERIQQLLLEAGGRMSQADIVEETDWSGPSVSRKLSQMEEDGLITRVQVGRGNLVFLDGHQPDITSSPTGAHPEENE